MTPATADAIRAHARQAYPNECVGALLGVLFGGVIYVVQLESSEHENEMRAYVRADEVKAIVHKAGEKGLELLGFYHSHPDGYPVPSAYDRSHAFPALSYVIVGVQGDELRSWVLNDDCTDFEEEPLVIGGEYIGDRQGVS